MKLVLFPAVDSERERRILAVADACRPPVSVINAHDTDAALQAIENAEAFFGKMTPALLQAAGNLRWVQSPTASLEHYLFPELVEHTCQLTNMRGLYSDVVAEHALGMMLAFARNLPHYARQQMAGRWEPLGGESSRTDWSIGPGVATEIDRAHGQLGGQTLGIIGLGEIGSALAKRALAFDMRVVAIDPRADATPAGIAACWPPDELGRLLEESDFVVICAPHTPRTAGMFGPRELARLKPTAYLINVGRGAIVDADALTEALHDGRLAGAGLDVVDPEPLPADHPLWRLPNVLITPHVAGFSPRIAERHLEVLLDNLRRFAAGQPLRNLVSKRDWY